VVVEREICKEQYFKKGRNSWIWNKYTYFLCTGKMVMIIGDGPGIAKNPHQRST
jgi:hypothetical protein